MRQSEKWNLTSNWCERKKLVRQSDDRLKPAIFWVMSYRSRQITPIKQRYHEINSQYYILFDNVIRSPKLQEQLGYGNLMKKVEDSCKEKARLRRIVIIVIF